MKNITLFTIVCLIMAITIVACSTKKITTTKVENTTPITPVAISYTNTAKSIIDNSCTGCHRGFSSYATIKKIVDKGEFKHEVIDTRDMPKGQQLSTEDYAKLKAWLEAGAPE